MRETKERNDILDLFEGLNRSQVLELRREILAEAIPSIRKMRERILARAENDRKCQSNNKTE
mgnify:CR=1 FL=1